MTMQAKVTKSSFDEYRAEELETEAVIAAKKQELKKLRLNYAQELSGILVGHTHKTGLGQILLVTDVYIEAGSDTRGNVVVCVTGKRYKRDGNLGSNKGYEFLYFTLAEGE